MNSTSYLSCVIPNSAYSEAAIFARLHGDIVITKGFRRRRDGSLVLEEISRVPYETFRIDRGAHGDSGSLAGHQAESNANPTVGTLAGVIGEGIWRWLKPDGIRTDHSE